MTHITYLSSARFGLSHWPACLACCHDFHVIQVGNAAEGGIPRRVGVLNMHVNSNRQYLRARSGTKSRP